MKKKKIPFEEFDDEMKDFVRTIRSGMPAEQVSKMEVCGLLIVAIDTMQLPEHYAPYRDLIQVVAVDKLNDPKLVLRAADGELYRIDITPITEAEARKFVP